MKKIKFDGKKLIRVCNRFSVPLQVLGCCLLYFVIEAVSRHSPVEAWRYMTSRPLIFLYNAFLIFTTTTVVYLFRRRIFARVMAFSLWLLLGIINGVVLMNRVTPFTGPDLSLLSDAGKIVGKYISVGELIGIIAALAAFVGFLIWFWFKAPKCQEKRRWVPDLIVIGGSIVLFAIATHAALSQRVLSTYFGNIAAAYEDYGYPYCLSVTIFDTGIQEPNGYSVQLVESIEASAEETEPDSGETPNIIFLQLESFFDPELVNFLNISQDPIPYFRQLKEEYSSGYFRVPAVGAGTINTEFEAITGMSLRYFGPGEYPYKTILTERTCESVPYVLKDLGYSTHVIHNNEATFYDRNKVYPMLGFDTFTSMEYMPDTTDTTPTGWLKDYILTDEILKCLDSTEEQDYIYTVSVQGHGDYPEEPMLTNPLIRVTGAQRREKNNYAWEYYCNQIHEMDEFLRELTEALKDYPEPVILVMYGDHLPTMGLQTVDLENRYLFQTEYVIWDNMGLPVEDGNLSAYQIGAKVLDMAGIHEGTMIRYHQARRNSRNYQRDLEVLQYDILYGEQYVYGGENPYGPADMQLGTEPVVLEKIQESPGAMCYFTGENFTAASRVEVDGVILEHTVHVSPSLLMVQDLELKGGESVRVVQMAEGQSGEILSGCEPVLYNP